MPLASRLSPLAFCAGAFLLLATAKAQPSEVQTGSDQNPFFEEKSAVGLEAIEIAQGSERQDSNTDGVAHPWSVGATAGTLVGIGGSVGYNFSKSFGIRALAGTLEFDLKTDETDLNYNLGGAALQADWHPFKNAWRLSIGLLSSESKMNASTNIDDGNSIQTEFSDNANVDVDFPSSISPYLGIGRTWGRQNSRWSLAIDSGYIFRGTPKVSISSSRGNCSFSTSSKGQTNIGESCNNPDPIRKDLDEALQTIDNGIKDNGFILNFVTNISLSYRF